MSRRSKSAALHLVEPEPAEPAEPEVKDIYGKWSAEIASRDWDSCHVAGDRGAVIDLPARPKWKGWLK